MKILITTQVFPPERHPTAVMVQEFAAYLTDRGHEVTVACGYPHHPTGRLIGTGKRRLVSRESHQGIDVVRGWHLLSPSRGMAARAAVMLSQAAGTAVAAHLCGARPDVVVNYGPPLIGPLLSSTVARRGHVPQVTVIYDLYPDVAIETGMLTSRAIIAIARWAERRTYLVSDRIVVLSEGFRRTLADKGVSSAKVDVIPVWLDPDEIRPSPRLNRWRTEQGIDSNAFVVLYAGTIGLVSGAEVMAEVADRLRDEPDLLFLFVGDGQTKAALESAAKQRGLTNIRFCAFQDRDRLNEVQATADVSVVTLAKGRGRTSVPSKVIGYLAAGRPTVASVDEDSDTAGCVLAGPSGIVVPPGDVRQIADAILFSEAQSWAESSTCRLGALAVRGAVCGSSRHAAICSTSRGIASRHYAGTSACQPKPRRSHSAHDGSGCTESRRGSPGRLQELLPDLPRPALPSTPVRRGRETR